MAGRPLEFVMLLASVAVTILLPLSAPVFQEAIATRTVFDLFIHRTAAAVAVVFLVLLLVESFLG